MDRVEEIEAAITSLSVEDYRCLINWLRAREQTLWDEQTDRDSMSGKLDFLSSEADSEAAQGQLREWPPTK